MEEQAQRALAAGETAIEEADAGDDEPYYESAEDEVGVVEFEASVLGVDVDFKRVAAGWVGWVEFGLSCVSIGKVACVCGE